MTTETPPARGSIEMVEWGGDYAWVDTSNPHVLLILEMVDTTEYQARQFLTSSGLEFIEIDCAPFSNCFSHVDPLTAET